MDELREFVATLPEPKLIPGLEAEWEQGATWVKELLLSKKEWPELRASQDDDYNAIRLYTSIYGYVRIFEPMNVKFRDSSLSDREKMLRAITFLVELLNIDLYRYIRSEPGADGFEGHVYRGMRISSKRLDDFARTAADTDLAKRYVTIPLSMMSTSGSRESALRFARRRKSSDSDSRAILWDISVYSLDPVYLAAYRRLFPASIVTSLCAVPVHGLSRYPQEGEVLLRGPFFQLVRMFSDEDSIRGEPLHVIQAIMLNSNRDHVTAVATDTEDDKRMRDIFRAMAISSRSVKCAEQAESYGLLADADYYRETAEKARREFPDIM
jgi:hypothetical protein